MSQVNFFMIDEDDAEFCEMLFARGETAMVVGRNYSSATPAHTKVRPAFTRDQELHLVNLLITPTPTCSRQSENGLYLFDAFRDVHIEFQRSYFYDEALVSGRIYAKIGWCEGAEANQKFRRWYSSIERGLKCNYRKLDAHFWIGPHAEQWSRAGGVLAFGSPLAARRSLTNDRTQNT